MDAKVTFSMPRKTTRYDRAFDYLFPNILSPTVPMLTHEKEAPTVKGICIAMGDFVATVHGCLICMSEMKGVAPMGCGVVNLAAQTRMAVCGRVSQQAYVLSII
jgi:hypothetical protein